MGGHRAPAGFGAAAPQGQGVAAFHLHDAHLGLVQAVGGQRGAGFHDMGHGRTVGYGNLCLLALEGRSDEEIKEAIAIAKACGVPVTSRQIAQTTAAELEAVAAKAVSLPDMKNMPVTVTTEIMLQAIARVDALSL